MWDTRLSFNAFSPENSGSLLTTESPLCPKRDEKAEVIKYLLHSHEILVLGPPPVKELGLVLCAFMVRTGKSDAREAWVTGKPV